MALLGILALSPNLNGAVEIASHNNIMDTMYSMAHAQKLTVILLINKNSAAQKESQHISWMFENVSSRLPKFVYCQHTGYRRICFCKNRNEQKKETIKYVRIECDEMPIDIYGNIPNTILYIFKDGTIIHTISNEILLSSAVSVYQHEEEIKSAIYGSYYGLQSTENYKRNSRR